MEFTATSEIIKDGLDESVQVTRVADDNKVDTEQTMGRIQMAIMQNLVNTMAQKNQYDTENIE